MSYKKHAFRWIFGIVLTAFTAYVLLDTFVIIRRYAVAEVESDRLVSVSPETIRTSESDEISESWPADFEKADSSQMPESTSFSVAEIESETVSTATTYRDANISVQLTEYRISDTTVYVADVQLASAEYLRTAFAQNTYGRNITEKTSRIADSVDAILAINGDYYGAQQSGYVIRNGVLYRDKADKSAEDLVIYADGSFEIVRESEVTAEELLENGAWNVLSFGPALVTDGTVVVSQNDEVGRAKASNPRTAIGIVDNLHYLFVVSDGRTAESEGLSLYELATFLKTLGAETAYNLDGGGSSSMVFQGMLINNPTTNGSKINERSVSDIVYIGY